MHHKASHGHTIYVYIPVLCFDIVSKTTGMIIPPLPGKKIFGNSEDNFVIRRMRGLQIFCEQVAANPFLRKDSMMESFLSMDPVSWEGAKKMAKRTLDQKCEGEMRWRQAVEQCQIPIDIEAKVSRIKQEIVILEKFIKVALESTIKLHEASQYYSSGVAQLHTSLQSWEEAELNEIRVLNEHSSMAKMLRNTCRMLGSEKVQNGFLIRIRSHSVVTS
jgi:hypothetical protein